MSRASNSVATWPPSVAAVDSSPPPSSPSPASGNNNGIRELTENDVLLGRGPGLSSFEGNMRFRELCDEREIRYKATTNRKEKKRLATEVFDLIQSRGGRFLKQDGDISYSEDWFEAAESVAIEKCKQALREKRGHLLSSTSQRTRSEITRSGTGSATSARLGECTADRLLSGQHVSRPEPMHAADSPSPLACVSNVNFDHVSSQELLDTLTLPTLSSSAPATSPHVPCCEEGVPPVVVEPIPLLFSGSPLLFQSQAASTNVLPQPIATHPLLSSPLLSSRNMRGHLIQGQTAQDVPSFVSSVTGQFPFVESVAMQSMLRDFALLQTQSKAAVALQNDIQKRTLERQLSALLLGEQDDKTEETTKVESTSTGSSNVFEVDPTSTALEVSEGRQAIPNEPEEEEVAAFLLSSLALVDRPTMTAEQEAEEKAALTESEKASILADALGDHSLGGYQPSKKARQDMDETSVSFLVRQMVLELEKIPVKKREAFTEAVSKATAEEFSVRRFEQFLRVEGMNAKLAAIRFTEYWEARKRVFGDEKFVMKMSLAEALKDDLVALETCVYTQLPNDASGRTVLYMEPHRHTREGYSSESMLRAIWYVSEVAAQENKDANGGVVQVCWFQNASLFDYDLTVFDRWAYFLSTCWPLKLLSNHLCCPTTISRRIVIPIVHTFVSKDWRARTLTHDCRPEDIANVLAQYGINKDILPTEMGGFLRSHQREWIANRRAAEMSEEELS